MKEKIMLCRSCTEGFCSRCGEFSDGLSVMAGLDGLLCVACKVELYEDSLEGLW